MSKKTNSITSLMIKFTNDKINIILETKSKLKDFNKILFINWEEK